MLASEHVRAGKKPARQERLQRLNQPALFVRRQISLNGARPADGGDAGFKIQNGAIGLGRTCRGLEADRLNSPVLTRQSDRAVRRSEINSNSFKHSWAQLSR